MVKTLYWQSLQHMLNFISMLYIALYKLLLTLIDIDSLIALNVRIN